MAIDTYAKLQSEISDELDRNDLIADVTQYSGGQIEGPIKRAISKVEFRVQRTLRVRQMEHTTAMVLAGGTTTYSLPSDFLSMQMAYLQVDPIVVLQQTSLANLFTDYPTTAQQQPQKFAITGANAVFRPVPDAAYTVPITYFQAIPVLSDSNTSNWLLEDCPDLYLYGSCLELTRFLGDDARLQVWKGFYDESIRLITDDNAAAVWSGVLVQAALPVTVVV